MTRLAIYLLIVTFIAGCGAKRPPQAGLPLIPGGFVNTLSSSVTISLKNHEKSISGRGVMLYRRPDQLRIVLLSPFGTRVMEALIEGERLTLVYPSEGVAYSGAIADMPPEAGQKGFAMMRWVLDSDQPKGAPDNGLFERPSKNGVVEMVRMRDGVVIEKSLSSGEKVFYRSHEVVSGVRLAMELDMFSGEGERITLSIEDPEVNGPVDENAFTLSLNGLTRYPLSEMKVR